MGWCFLAATAAAAADDTTRASSCSSRYKSAIFRPCMKGAGGILATPKIVVGKSTFNVHASFRVPFRCSGIRGSWMIRGTRIDSSNGYHFSANPCSPCILPSSTVVDDRDREIDRSNERTKQGAVTAHKKRERENNALRAWDIIKSLSAASAVGCLSTSTTYVPLSVVKINTVLLYTSSSIAWICCMTAPTAVSTSVAMLYISLIEFWKLCGSNRFRHRVRPSFPSPIKKRGNCW